MSTSGNLRKRKLRKLPDDVQAAAEKLQAILDLLSVVHLEDLFDHTVSYAAGIAVDLVHEIIYEPET